jgi:tetratricopeptide (TPR) repeat protein
MSSAPTPAKLSWDEAVALIEGLLADGRLEQASVEAEAMRARAVQYGRRDAATALTARMLEVLPDDTLDRWSWLVALADDTRDRGDLDGAQRHYEECLALAKRLAERASDHLEHQRTVAVTHDRLGDVHALRGNGEEAHRCYEEGMASVRALAKQHPDAPELRRDLAISYERLGELQTARGKLSQARRHHEDGLAIRRALVEADPEHAEPRRDLATGLGKLGDLYLALRRRTQARRLYEEALVLRHALAEREPERSDLRRDLSISHAKLGDLLLATGDRDGARRCYDAGLAVFRLLVEREPDSPQTLGDLAITCERMAVLEPEAATRWLGEAIDVHRRRMALAPDDASTQRELAVALVQLGQSATAKGDRETGVAAFKEAYGLLRPLRERGALEAQYHGIVDQLARAFGG